MKISQLLSMFILLSLIVVACGGPAATATQAPAATETSAQGGCPPPPSFNEDKLVSFALPSFALSDPQGNGLILQVLPPKDEPTETAQELLESGACGVIIGHVIAVRDLRLSDQQVLHEGKEYDLKVVPNENQELIVHFVNNEEGELTTSIVATLRTIESREITPPETFITIKDICYSWLHVQVCTEPSPSLAIPDQQKTLQDTMLASITTLEEKGWLKAADINIAGTIPDMVGTIALEKQQASLLAAPTVNFPSASGEERPDNGALLGVVVVVLPIQNEVTLSEGNYAVFAYQDPSNPEAWQGRFVSPDGAETFVPAKYVEMRGQIEEPLAIVIDLRICLCFFEC